MNKPLFGRLRHLHFMGAGGVGMCGLAEVLLTYGLEVSGCDLNRSERTERLVRLGAKILTGHDPAHIDGADGLVITAAVPGDQPEVVAARNAGLPIIRRAELLAELLRRHQGVAVAGTHGKTTTSAMITCLLIEAGLDPTAVIGGRIHSLGSHARCGQSPLMVCEADEFDRSFLDLNPVWTVITNVEPEHLECYGGVDQLEQAFVDFANATAFYGAVIACCDDPALTRLLPRINRRVVTYGLSQQARLRAEVLAADATGTRLQVWDGDHELGEVQVTAAGRHNALNALAAIAVARELEIPITQLRDGLTAFSGVARRFEIAGERDRVTVIDDYAHHPTEVRATLDAARERFPERRLVALFQPHLYSRTRDLAEDFGEVLAAAELVIVLPIYPAREQPIAGVSAQLVSDAAARHGACVCLTDFDQAVALLDEQLRPADVLLAMGAGNVNHLAAQWLGGSG